MKNEIYISLSSFLNWLYPLRKNQKAMQKGINFENEFWESLKNIGLNIEYNQKRTFEFYIEDIKVVIVFKPDFIIENLEIYETKKYNGFLPEKYFRRILLQAQFYSFALGLPCYLVFIEGSKVRRIMKVKVGKKFWEEFKEKLYKYFKARLIMSQIVERENNGNQEKIKKS